MKKGIKLDISSDFDLNDLIKQRFKKNVNLRISWKDFFNYPFFHKKYWRNNGNEDTKKIRTDLIEKKKD